MVSIPSEKYESKWVHLPQVGVKIKKYLSCHHLVSYTKPKQPNVLFFILPSFLFTKKPVQCSSSGIGMTEYSKVKQREFWPHFEPATRVGCSYQISNELKKMGVIFRNNIILTQMYMYYIILYYIILNYIILYYIILYYIISKNNPPMKMNTTNIKFKTLKIKLLRIKKI